MTSFDHAERHAQVDGVSVERDQIVEYSTCANKQLAHNKTIYIAYQLRLWPVRRDYSLEL